MATTSVALRPPAPMAPVQPLAGVAAGCLAGVLYLAAQVLFAAGVHAADPWSPLQRISAMLLGDQFLPPSAKHPITMWGMALLIHFGIAVVLGRLVDIAVRDSAGMTALLRGVGVGLAVYVVNYWLVAPLAFPWFEENRGLTTVLAHALFGGTAAWFYVHLRARRAHPRDRA